MSFLGGYCSSMTLVNLPPNDPVPPVRRTTESCQSSFCRSGRGAGIEPFDFIQIVLGCGMSDANGGLGDFVGQGAGVDERRRTVGRAARGERICNGRAVRAD